MSHIYESVDGLTISRSGLSRFSSHSIRILFASTVRLMKELKVIEHPSLEVDWAKLRDGRPFASLNNFERLSLHVMISANECRQWASKERSLEIHNDPQSQFWLPEIYDSSLLQCVDYQRLPCELWYTSNYIHGTAYRHRTVLKTGARTTRNSDL